MISSVVVSILLAPVRGGLAPDFVFHRGIGVAKSNEQSPCFSKRRAAALYGALRCESRKSSLINSNSRPYQRLR
jgi:hypothetical protein